MRTHPFAKKYANSRNKREMKKSRVPSAQECQESPEECVRAGNLGAPRGLRAPPAHLKPKAGSSTSSLRPRSGERPPLLAAAGKTKKGSGLIGVCSPSSSLSPRPQSPPAPGPPRSARRRSPEERPGEGLPGTAGAPPAPRASPAGGAGRAAVLSPHGREGPAPSAFGKASV